MLGNIGQNIVDLHNMKGKSFFTQEGITRDCFTQEQQRDFLSLLKY